MIQRMRERILSLATALHRPDQAAALASVSRRGFAGALGLGLIAALKGMTRRPAPLEETGFAELPECETCGNGGKCASDCPPYPEECFIGLPKMRHCWCAGDVEDPTLYCDCECPGQGPCQCKGKNASVCAPGLL